MAFKDRLQEVKVGFLPSFWVANGVELFERLAFYGQQAILAIFLHESLKLTDVQTGALMGYFGGAVYFGPIIGGALADRFGFRKALSFAFAILAIGYFAMGSMASPWMAFAHDHLSIYSLVFVILMVTAVGPAFVKPCVVGTTAMASKENVRSLGYSIYYTLVNIGGALGPIMAFFVRKSIGIENVFRVSALSCAMMFVATLIFYYPPELSREQAVRTVGAAIKNMFVVLANFRFMLFLFIFSGFWVMFFQFFYAMPLYIRGYVDANADVDLILTTDALTIIFFQVIVSWATKKIPASPSMVLGFLIASCSMLVVSIHPSIWLVVLALIIFSLGEMTQAPRFYEYCSRLAPKGKEGVYMGYAFLPISIGSLIAGQLSGRLIHYYGEVAHKPREMWWVLSAIGFGATVLMMIYNKVFARRSE